MLPISCLQAESDKKRWSRHLANIASDFRALSWRRADSVNTSDLHLYVADCAPTAHQAASSTWRPDSPNRVQARCPDEDRKSRRPRRAGPGISITRPTRASNSRSSARARLIRVSASAAEGGVVRRSLSRRRAIGKPSLHDVELPQLHRSGPLPPEVVGPLAPPGPGLDEPGADQDPVDARPDGTGSTPFAGELVGVASWSPPGMLAAELDHPELRAGGRAERARGAARLPSRHGPASTRAGRPSSGLSAPRRIA